MFGKSHPQIKPTLNNSLIQCVILFSFVSLMANKNTNKTPTTIKPKKPGWIRACFGLGSSNKTRFVSEKSPLDEVATSGGARKRKLGLGFLRVVKRPWCKKKDKTTSLKIRKKVVEGPTATKVVYDDGSHEAQGPNGDHTQKEFHIAKETSFIKEDTKVNKPIPFQHTKLKQFPSSSRILAKQSSRRNAKRSEKDAVIGMWILVIILVIMLLCGRLCAILCTSVWLYCMPQLIKTTKSNKNIAQGKSLSVKSERERKKWGVDWVS